MAQRDFNYLIQPRNPHTQAKHRKEVFWQITLPIAIGGILIAAGCALPIIAVARGGEVGVWRDVSLIWLIVPSLIFSLIPLALLAALAYGVIRLIGVLPAFFFRVQSGVARVRIQVGRLAQKATRPIVKVSSLSAAAKAGWNRLTTSQ